MSKYKVKGKRRKKKGIVERYAATPAEGKPVSASRALALAVSAIVLLGGYVAAWAMQDSEYMAFSVWITMAYYTALPLLIIIFVILNRGISNDIPTREQLPEDMSEDEKDAFIEEIKACRRRSRPWLIPIIPLALIVGFDIIFYYLFS
ncbi:MAG: hypothetical protein IJ519_00820 [Clostridia bacterium]|nr:hypothetical protein [Clostridia bacterium]